MPPRKCNRTKQLVARESRRVVLPIKQEVHQAMIDDHQSYREYVDAMLSVCPELFPPGSQAGYMWHDMLTSKKMPEVRLRRIKLKQVDEQGQAQVFTIVPSFVMPYMSGYTDEVEKALFLRGLGVPFWGLTYVFGRNEVYWERLVERLGHYDLVGTTVKDPTKLPEHLLADEKHARFNGEKAYIATTAGEDCVLGVSITLQADTAHLKEAYGHFKREAQQLLPGYAPKTVNTDGWTATQNAWQSLFPLIVVIQCFLHAFLTIRTRCKRLADFPEIKQRVWDIYRAATPGTFYKQVGDLYAWAHHALSGKAWQAVEKLCAKTGAFLLAFDYPQAYRTSNMIDRCMQPLARCLYSARFFHGHLMSAEYGLRAWALLHNFRPYCPRSKISKQYHSPVHKLNGFVYHDNWLHNLLISTSVQRIYAHHRIR